MTIDIEITNRCNAGCSFCPRDQTPHEGLMTPEVFAAALRQSVAYRDLLAEHLSAEELARVNVSLCGLGEPLLHRDAPSFVRQVRDEGIVCSLSSNASLLDEQRARRLVDAGLSEIFLNVGEVGRDYEAVYGLPFERTCENVVRFTELAGDACDVWIVLVDHRRDAGHAARTRAFWRERGIKKFLPYELINRGGALSVEGLRIGAGPQAERARSMVGHDPATLRCAVPFVHPFIGYDGQYYLCSSDWRKQTPMGSVLDRSFVDVVRDKLRFVESRAPVCHSCGHDPLNQLAGSLRDLVAGATTPAENDARFAAAVERGTAVDDHISRLVVLGS